MKDHLINSQDLPTDTERFTSKLKLAEYFHSDDEEENITVTETNLFRNKYNLNSKKRKKCSPKYSPTYSLWISLKYTN